MPIKRAHSPSLPPLAPTSSSLNDFVTRGWVCVRNFLSPSELLVLQTESNALYNRQSVEAVTAQGCVLDVMAQYPMRDSDPARVDSNCYLQVRAKQLKSKDNADQQVFEYLLFEKLPTIVGHLMTAGGESETRTGVLFFNEHYVVKPPRSHVEFRWHRDDDEQLAMCVHQESICPYVSAWCALDDVTSRNGALQFVSLDVLSGNEERLKSLESFAGEPVTATAGDVIFFLSNVWHYSSSNESDGARRAFYAQYSSEMITARPKDSSPLSFGIPCRTLSLSLEVRAPTTNYRGGRCKKVKHDA